MAVSALPTAGPFHIDVRGQAASSEEGRDRLPHPPSRGADHAECRRHPRPAIDEYRAALRAYREIAKTAR